MRPLLSDRGADKEAVLGWWQNLGNLGNHRLSFDGLASWSKELIFHSFQCSHKIFQLCALVFDYHFVVRVLLTN